MSVLLQEDTAPRMLACDWCGKPFEPKSPRAECCSDPCRAARWKHRTGYVRENGRNGAQNGRERRPSKPSGVQVSLGRGVKEIAAEFGVSREHAREVLARALPDRQKEALNRRRAA